MALIINAWVKVFNDLDIIRVKKTKQKTINAIWWNSNEIIEKKNGNKFMEWIIFSSLIASFSYRNQSIAIFVLWPT